ncbi:MAG: hypothetical protein QM757_28965 [Paludibaculum sp.]
MIPVTALITFPIIEAKLDPNRENELITVLDREDTLGFYAAIILGSRPGSPVVDAALLRFFRSAKYEGAIFAAANALSRHGEFGWADEGELKWAEFKELAFKLHLAGELAAAGHYKAWEFIRTNIVTKQPFEENLRVALGEVPRFEGMRDRSGKLVNLSEALDEMGLVAPLENCAAILAAMPTVGRPPSKMRK